MIGARSEHRHDYHGGQPTSVWEESPFQNTGEGNMTTKHTPTEWHLLLLLLLFSGLGPGLFGDLPANAPPRPQSLTRLFVCRVLLCPPSNCCPSIFHTLLFPVGDSSGGFQTLLNRRRRRMMRRRRKAEQAAHSEGVEKGGS